MLRLSLLVAALLCAVAFPAAAQSRRGEMRGAWMGEGYGRDWPSIMRSLKDNGFNALFPNLSTGGAAFYPSKVLPAARGAQPGRDELAEAVKAAKEHGIELHVWRINWVLLHCPDDLLASYEKDGRLMRNSKGQLAREDPSSDLKVDWLCPSHPENRKLEKESMLELVRSYDIAGIHFDYMRYPGPDYCYCDHCQDQFQKDTGAKIARWPEDVVEGGAYADRYADWRRQLQTSLVVEISQAAHHIKPDIFVSLAAFPDPDWARTGVFQDWPAWVQAGALEFICFMNYTLDNAQLGHWLGVQRKLIHSTIPVYAGLGSFLMQDPSTLIEQVEISRNEGADGFLAFAYYSGDLDKWFPALRATVTAAEPDPMPHGGPPAMFSFSGPALAKPASLDKVLAGSQLEVEMVVGAPPPSTPAEPESEGAEQVASVLRRATEARTPVPTYEPPLSVITDTQPKPRISGRVVAETPSGAALVPLGAFDADLGIKRALRFLAPQGPFRIAVYGEIGEPTGKKHEFVVRSPLLVGVEAETMAQTPEAMHAELDRLLAEACAQLDAAKVPGLTGTIELHITGPGGGDWWLRLKDGSCEYGAGGIESPDVSFTASAEEALAVARGEADLFSLRSSGQVIITGSVELLEKMMSALGYAPGL